jgi:hypothetical protein
MPRNSEITRTEQRIAEIDALQQTIDLLQQDLQLYGQALRRELDLLQKEVVAAPVEEEPEEEQQPVDEQPPEPVAAESFPSDPLPDTSNLDDADFTDLDSEIGVGLTQAKARSPFELEELEGGSDKVGGKPVSVLISDGSVSEEPLNGWVLDRPAGGLKILVDDEIKVGRVIGIRPNREHPDAQWINVSVKSVKPERQSYLITCHFLERPPWKALALLNG